MSTLSRCVVVLATALALAGLSVPLGVVPPVTTLAPAAARRHRPARGASRDRSLPGKTRVRARRQAP